MPTEDTIRHRVRQFISDNFLYGKGTDSIAGTDSLMETGVIDSVGAFELIQFLEGEFEVRVADNEVMPQNLDTIDRIAAFVERKVHAGLSPVESGHAG